MRVLGRSDVAQSQLRVHVHYALSLCHGSETRTLLCTKAVHESTSRFARHPEYTFTNRMHCGVHIHLHFGGAAEMRVISFKSNRKFRSQLPKERLWLSILNIERIFSQARISLFSKQEWHKVSEAL